MKNKKRNISPSILSANFTRLKEDINIVEKCGVNRLHLDVMDGHFVPNLTIGPVVIKKLRLLTKKIFDVHLMISPFDKYIKPFSDAGADITFTAGFGIIDETTSTLNTYTFHRYVPNAT